MSLMQICLQGSLMIAIVCLLRALLLRRVPKMTFYILWLVVLARLLVPFSIPVAVPDDFVPGWITSLPFMPDPISADEAGAALAGGLVGISSRLMGAVSWAPSADPMVIVQRIWMVGSAVALTVLVVLYIYNMWYFSRALPVENRIVRGWVKAHPTLRPIRVRESRRIHSPLTYGVVRPVIVVPVDFPWNDASKAALMLEHEYTHIVRFDILYKALVMAAVCVYWFNPLIWVMAALSNQDIELSCDERVACRLNPHGRSVYAHALIDAVERQGVALPVFSGFGASAVAGRILALGNVHRPSLLQGLPFALGLAVTAAFMAVTPIVATAPVDSLARAGLTLFSQPTSLPEGGNEQVREGVNVLTTPRYVVRTSDEAFQGGLDWEYAAGGDPRCPDGAADVLAVTDRTTGELAFIAYGFPYAKLYADPDVAVAPYAMEGFCQFVVGRPAADDCATVVAIPAGRDPELAGRCPESLEGIVLGDGAAGSLDVNSDVLRESRAAGLCPSFGSHGLRNEVWGLDEGDADPAAYLAHATMGARSTTVETTAFSIEIPVGMYVASYGYNGFFYKEWDLLAPERRAALCFELPDGNDVSVYCRPVGSAPERDELWLQTRVELVCGDAPAPEGYEIVVEGQVRFTNASGDLPASSVQAEADLRMVAGWL